MKEKLYTIDLNDAVRSGDECLFCWLERKLEQSAVEFVLGSSYMESDVREKTDQQGFCRPHTKIMYDYGNALGNAWIQKTRLQYVRKHLKAQTDSYKPQKSGWFGAARKSGPEGNGVSAWIREQESHCYVCARVRDTYERMLGTFVYMLKQDEDFGKQLTASCGFCVHHFADVADICEKSLSEKEKEVWMPELFSLMEKNLDRVQEDINWMIEKYDYNNQDADWKNSRDALQRTMQKTSGGHPADPVFKSK